MKAIKFVAYIILSVCLIYFGKSFYEEYNKITEESAARGDTLGMGGLEPPDYTTDDLNPNDDTDPNASDPSDPDGSASPDPDSETNGGNEGNGNVQEEGANDTNEVASAVSPGTGTDSKTESTNRIGFYVGGFVLTLLALGLMSGFDLTRYFSNRTVDALYNDDGVGTDDSSIYESAEQEWARGDYLEAIRILREYLKANPKQQHAAIRIAEIYEKDLKNPLAAALEYEEILNQKLTPDRWGWSAIHLANIYSGPLNKPEKAIELLRTLVERYPETAAGEKASQRLAMIDGQ